MVHHDYHHHQVPYHRDFVLVVVVVVVDWVVAELEVVVDDQVLVVAVVVKVAVGLVEVVVVVEVVVEVAAVGAVGVVGVVQVMGQFLVVLAKQPVVAGTWPNHHCIWPRHQLLPDQSTQMVEFLHLVVDLPEVVAFPLLVEEGLAHLQVNVKHLILLERSRMAGRIPHCHQHCIELELVAVANKSVQFE